jgi:hypothetical protein
MFGEPFGIGTLGDDGSTITQVITPTVTQNEYLADILGRRRLNNSRGDCVWFLEKHGANIVEPTAFEPDPNTHRSDYYYNAIENVLYRKSKVTDGSVWVKMR